MLVRRETDGACGLLTKLAQRGQLGIDLLEPWGHRTEQALTRLRRGDAACSTGQQPNTEPFLKSTDGVAQRGLRHAKLCSRPGKAPLARDREEGKEVVGVFA